MSEKRVCRNVRRDHSRSPRCGYRVKWNPCRNSRKEKQTSSFSHLDLRLRSFDNLGTFASPVLPTQAPGCQSPSVSLERRRTLTAPWDRPLNRYGTDPNGWTFLGNIPTFIHRVWFVDMDRLVRNYLSLITMIIELTVKVKLRILCPDLSPSGKALPTSFPQRTGE